MHPTWSDTVIELGALRAVPVRVYGREALCSALSGRAAALVLHLHGGAFQGGSLESGSTIAMLFVDAGAVVVAADYPCGRDHPFPEALEMAYAVLLHLDRTRAARAGRGSRLFVAGEEAGGNLAAALAMLARDRQGPPLAGQILLSPMLDPRMATCSIRDAAAGPVGCKWADGWRAYLGSPEKASHPYAAPSSASRLAGLAPALVLTTDGDPMQDEGLAYARRLRDSGVVVQSQALQAGELWASGARAAITGFFITTAPRPKAAAKPQRIRSAT